MGFDLPKHTHEHIGVLRFVDLRNFQAHTETVFLRVQILFAVSDKLRRAINYHYGKAGQATRQETKSWLWQYGHSRDEEILAALYEAESAPPPDSETK